MLEKQETVQAMPTARGCPFDPPAEFADLRREAPIARMTYPDGHAGWLVSDYELAREVLAHPRISARHELRRFPVPFPIKLGPAAPGVFVGMDAPEHTRYRKPLAKAFTVRQSAEFEPAIERITEECLDAMADQGSPADFVQAFALPFPIRVISELVGGTQEVTDEFQRLRIPVLTPGTPREEVMAAMRRTGELMGELVALKRAEPGQDLMSTLIAGGDFSDEELASIALQVLGAGHETTAHMISLGVYLLFENDALRQAMSVEGKASETAVDELLRYLTIAQFVTRAVLEDAEFGGVQVKKGEAVTISLASANRDALRFEDPDAFDPDRARNGHLTFGHGVHKCVGLHLARTELRVALPALLRRFPKLRLDVPPEDLETRDAMTTYGVKTLPVSW